MTNVTASVVVIFAFLFLCVLLGYIRRMRNRAGTRVNRTGGRPATISKPWRAQTPSGYFTYNRATPSAPPPAHVLQHHPRGHDTYPGHAHGQGVPPSSIRTIPNQRTPGSPVSVRPRSGVTSRPISSLDPYRTSMHRNESATLSPSSPTSPPSILSSRSVRRDVASAPSSPPPQSPSTAVRSTVSPPSTHPSPATAQPNAPLPFSLASMPTGASYNVDDPPPAYTPV